MDIPLSPLVLCPPCTLSYAGQVARDQGLAQAAVQEASGDAVGAELTRRGAAIVYSATRPVVLKPLGCMNAMMIAMTTPAAIAGVSMRQPK